MSTQVDRRTFLKYSAAIGAGTSVAMAGVDRAAAALSNATSHASIQDSPWTDATIAEMQAAMASGEATALSITRDHIARIEAMDWAGPRVNSIIEVNPDAEAIAAALDRERAAGHVRGPLHGIPIVLKDVVATADRMETTAGSLALVGSKAPRDAGVAARLREAGAILLGKANMSEWNAFRGWPTRGGWSGRAGIGRNPYALSFSTGDSSSGSAAAVAASFAAGARRSRDVRLDRDALLALRRRRAEAHDWARQSLRNDPDLVHPGCDRPDRADRDRPGDAPRRHGRRRPARPADRGERRARAARLRPVPGSRRSARRADRRVARTRPLEGRHGRQSASRALMTSFGTEGATLVDPVELPNWLDATGDHIGVMFTEFRARHQALPVRADEHRDPDARRRRRVQRGAPPTRNCGGIRRTSWRAIEISP